MVQVIGTKNCQKCRLTVKKFDELGVEHTYLDASEVPELVAKAKDVGHSTAPLVFKGGEFLWSDYRIDRIRELAA